jgi:hypothetical protein
MSQNQKLGRPKLHEDDTRMVYPLRISKRERTLFEDAAKLDNLDLSKWMRKVLTANALNVLR